MKIILTAGGGGHFSPLLCVYSALPKDVEVLVVGRKYGLEGDTALSFEYQTATSLGMPYVSITTGRWQRKFTKHTIPSLFKLPKGFLEAYKVVKSFRPDVVVSFGGYVSFPVVVAAWFLRIPVVIHEQTLEAGAANRIASFFAKKVCVSWKSSMQFFPKEKVVLTGNPIRRFKIQDSRFKIQENEKLPIVFITGGSLGSHAINVLVEGCIKKLLENYVVIHQTGGAKQFSDFERLEGIQKNLPEKLRKRYILTKFVIHDMVGSLLQQADLVIARSGINTVTELLSFGKPSLLIPLPFSQKDEQQKNAELIANIGLGEIAKQTELTPNSFCDRIYAMLANKTTYQKHADRAKEYIIPDATNKIISILESVTKSSNKNHAPKI